MIPYMMLLVMRGFIISTTGPRIPWTGSNKPQSSTEGLLSEAPSVSLLTLFDSRPLRPFFLPLPVATTVGRRDETAVLREATRSFACLT